MSRGVRELALLRLVAQGLAGPRLDSPSAVAERLLCLQAQDYWSGLASVAVRSDLTLAEVEAAFDSGVVVRAWPLRGTLHLLAAENLGWMRELLAPRQLAAAALREQRLGLDAQVIARAKEVVVETLPAKHDAVVFASRNGVPACTIVDRGEVVATWRRKKKGVQEAFTPMPLVPNRKDLPNFGQIPWQNLSK